MIVFKIVINYIKFEFKMLKILKIKV